MPRVLTAIFVLVVLLPGCVKRVSIKTGGDRDLMAGETAEFGMAQELPGGTRVNWTMGEGTELEGTQVRHAWHAPGSYQVKVVVQDADGQKREDLAQVKVARPPLMQVLPVDTEVLVLLDQPARRWKDFPLFLERLLVSGQDANAALTRMRDMLGFDPLEEKGLLAAGLDPKGGIAGVSRQIQGKTSFVIVYPLADIERAKETIQRIFAGRAKVEVTPAESDPAIVEIKEAGRKQLIAATLVHRGHLWVAPFENDGADPTDALAAVKTARSGLLQAEDYASIAQSRREPGGLHLYISSGLFKRVAAGDPMQEKLTGLLKSLRADLDFTGDGMQMDGILQLSGPEVAVLAGALKARNPVPDFTNLTGPGGHLVAKFSLSILELAKSVAQLAGHGNAWAMANASLDSLEQSMGIQAKSGVVENLGDNYLVSVRLQPAEVLVSTSGPAGQMPKFEKMFQAELYAQLKQPKLLVETLDKLAGMAQVGAFLRKVSGKENQWTIGPAAQLTAAVEREFLVVTPTGKQTEAAMQRLKSAEKKAAGWPESMQDRSRQVLVIDVKGLLKDLSGAQVPRGNFGAEMNRSLITIVTSKLAALEKAILEAVLEKDALSVRLNVTLR